LSDVYFTDFRTSGKDNVFSKIKKIFMKAGFNSGINENELIAIKTHFGEYGNIAYIPAQIIRILVDIINESGAKPFITDTNTLYMGNRNNAVSHLKNASMNGFVMEVTGAPIIIADGLRGNDYRVQSMNGKHYKEIKIASAIYDSDAVFVTSHVKGHELYGFGGALKNIAMGCTSPSGKQTIHSDLQPKVKEGKCNACSLCIERCPASAISLTKNKKALIDQKKCISCGECTCLCPNDAIPVNWKTDHKELHERTAEVVKGIIDTKQDRWMFLNFLMNVTPECDCYFWNDSPIVPDIGILASNDPVSIDRASADLINKASPMEGSKIWDRKPAKDNLRTLYDIDWEYLLRYAEEIGIGENSYNLITL